MNYHHQPLEEAIKNLTSNQTLGLTQEEVNKRLATNGPNKLKEKKKKTFAQRFFEQFKDVMILILIAAAIVSFVIACIEKNPMEFFEPALILLIVIINAVMGVMQESKAEKALDALKNMSSPHAKVIRDGKEQIIESSMLVVGDVIKLEAGDFVPADARLISSTALKAEESALTGESVPSEKFHDQPVLEKAPLGDRTNMVFSGCSITYGTATAIVTATGMDTEMGKIANLLSGEAETKTPLQQKLASLGKYLGIVALTACAIIFIIGFINASSKEEYMDVFMTAVSLAVSAIPEGLPAIVTIVLSIGVQRMVKKNAIIRRLPAVETLGSASVICSDKTGTLTQNRMTLVKTYLDGNSGLDTVNADMSQENRRMLNYGTLCSDGSVVADSDGIYKHIGDPTETAIVYASLINGFSKEDLFNNNPRLNGVPFDSDRKLMSVIVKENDKLLVITKGAFDSIEKICTSGDLATAKNYVDKMSSDSLRVLAIAYKYIDAIPSEVTSATLENNLTFMGLVGMIDPPRPEAKKAVAICRKAGIKPVMITGDHIVTATAIAKEIGIYVDGDFAITGAELDTWTDTELDEKVESISVYARVSPENKIRIVKAWQRKGKVVSMTGDGVNDAPALKAADIGCAMGITGTDVAKGAADMTLTDDNFATIVDAVKEGRGIYANIKKVVGFLLGTNIGEVVLVFIAMLLFNVSPLLSMQLLWINLVTDSFPAIALGMEDVENGVMDVPPKPKNEGLFAHGFGVRIVLQGFMFGGLALLAFFIGFKVYGDVNFGRTMAFITLSCSQVIHSFNMRSERSIFKIGPFSNKKLNLAALGSLLLVALVVLVPGVNTIFGLASPYGAGAMPYYMYLISLGLAIVPLIIMELAKAIGLVKHHSDKKIK
ncbi:MAG: calcium-translocating P-type ATPase, PMCA-type [Clostridia bacterium]|nr:calcium-translocating P-type ATPase, PMCA-type [Clostridia bacterium]